MSFSFARISLSRFVAFTALAFTPLSSSFAQNSGGFVATRGIDVGGSPFSTATADLNKDGIPDIVVADGTSSTSSNGTTTQTVQGIVVLLGNGDGTFKPAVHYATTNSASFVVLADVDGDGNVDAITANFDPTSPAPGGDIDVLLGKGDGTFQPAVAYSVPNNWVDSIYVGDFNGDGHPDLAVGTQTTSGDTLGLAIFLNNGHGTFHLGQQTANVAPYGVADFDKDGKLDLVVADYTPGSQGPSVSVGVLYGNGNGTFTRTGPTYYIATDSAFYVYGSQIAIGDFNEDGYLDLAIADGLTPGSLLLLLGQPNGSFVAAANPPGLDSNPTSILSADFNHDGHLDLAVLSGSGNVDVLFGNGNGTFSFRDIYGNDGEGQDSGGRLSAADLNGDGNLDLISVNNSGTITPTFGKPGGTFEAERLYALGSFNNVQTVTGDFTGDGKPDIAVLNSGGGCSACYGSVSVMQGQGNGLFKPLGIRYKLTTLGGAFAVGDVNGDGKLDLVVNGEPVYGGNPATGVLMGNGDGTFQPERAIPNAPSVDESIALADMNNDGKLDIVTQSGVSLGNGNGTFQAAINFNFDGGTNFAIGDFNRDGKLDLAFVTDEEPAAVNIFLGDGTGHVSQTAYSSAALPWGDIYRTRIAVGHFTTNGYLGVVAGVEQENFFSHSNGFGGFAILGGKGDGTLMPAVSYDLTQYLQDFQTGDFNGDGLDDVAALNGGSGNPQVDGVYSLLSIYNSNGNGTVTHSADFGAGGIGSYNGGSLSKADFNGDGAIDLAGNVGGIGVGVLMNSRGSSMALTSSPGTTASGQPVMFTATITASFRFSGGVTGSVAFYDTTTSTTLLGTSPVGPGGIATLTTSSLGTGIHHITAFYGGGANFNPQTSNTLTEVITP